MFSFPLFAITQFSVYSYHIWRSKKKCKSKTIKWDCSDSKSPNLYLFKYYSYFENCILLAVKNQETAVCTPPCLLGARPLCSGQLDKAPIAKLQNSKIEHQNSKCLPLFYYPFLSIYCFSRCFRVSGDVKAFQSPQLENVHLHFAY